jgi:hypothetical protein
LSTRTRTLPAPVPAGTVNVLRSSRSRPEIQPAVVVGGGSAGPAQLVSWPNGDVASAVHVPSGTKDGATKSGVPDAGTALTV